MNEELTTVKSYMDQVVKACDYQKCANPTAETNRYGLVMLMYSMDPNYQEPYKVYLSLHICETCSINVQASQFIQTKELEEWSEIFRIVSKNNDNDPLRLSRILDESKLKVAWRPVGKYVHVQAQET